jgi:hypothetical protein
MSLAGSCFASEPALGPFHHGVRERGGTIFGSALPSIGGRSMREAAMKANDIEGMWAWAGQSASMTTPLAAGDLIRKLWDDAQVLLR